MGLDIVELVMRVEEEFGVEIADEDAEKLLTAGDIANHVAYLLQAPLPRHTEIWERVRAILVDQCAVSPEKITRDARLVQDLRLD